MTGRKIGFAVCASFCNFENAAKQLVNLVQAGNEVQCILSEKSAGISTRFGESEYWISQFTEISGKKPILDIVGAEPIGPQKMFDILAVCPCTGNTLSKIACGITDTVVPMAIKSHLRASKPVVIALSTNDGLSGSAQNLIKLLNTKNYYFVPLTQDDPYRKPNSLICDYEQLNETIECALNGVQLRPLFI